VLGFHCEVDLGLVAMRGAPGTARSTLRVRDPDTSGIYLAPGTARFAWGMKKGSTWLVEPCANGCGFGLGEIHGAVGDGLDFFAVTGGDFTGLLVVNAHDVQTIGHFSQ